MTQAPVPVRIFPTRERLSAVMAIVLLAYVAARFVQFPETTIAIQFVGIYLPLQLGINTALALLAAGLTASGADWLLSDHPQRGSQPMAQHWLLPAMTAWVLSLVLTNLQFSPQWWLAFAASALLLVAIFIAEYNSVSTESRLHEAATLALTAIAYGLFLLLAISVRGLGLRLFLALPAIALGAFLTGTRVNLLSSKDWRPLQLTGVTFVITQVAAALHYLPISALGYGLILLGLVYALSGFATAVNSGEPIKQALREPAVALGVFWFLALIFH